MEFGWYNLLQVIGALAFFIYGMKVMSEGIQRAAGDQLRDILRSMTKNRYLGILTGFLTTAAVQSSSATTVMTVSFVNAGLITLVESAGVMMGANIGTTITGWLVSILGFKIKLHTLSLPLLAIGFPLMFINRGKIKHWGEFIIGFALLFMGLSFLKEQVPDLRNNPEVLQWLSGWAQWGILSRILFVLVGALLTILVQSSSAAMTLTMTMCLNGWLPFDVGAAMVLGENIGTTITAELASLVGNVNARRSARIHSMFNIVGVTWMVLLMPIFLAKVAFIIQQYFNVSDPFSSPDAIPIALSLFHTTFNLANVLLLIAFVPWLVNLAIKTVPDRSDDGETEDDLNLHMEHVPASTRSPELTIVEVQKEILIFGQKTSTMSGYARQLLNTVNQKEQRQLFQKIRNLEKYTDAAEIEFIKFLTKLSSQELTETTTIKVRGIMNICNDLERIGDIFYRFSKTLERKNEQKIWFTPEQRERLNELFDLLDEAFEIMLDNLAAEHYSRVNKGPARAMEKKINKKRNQIRAENQINIGEEGYNLSSALIYNNLFSYLERAGDHIENITDHIIGDVK